MCVRTIVFLGILVVKILIVFGAVYFAATKMLAKSLFQVFAELLVVIIDFTTVIFKLVKKDFVISRIAFVLGVLESHLGRKSKANILSRGSESEIEVGKMRIGCFIVGFVLETKVAVAFLSEVELKS
jgi:hypothetical protein